MSTITMQDGAQVFYKDLGAGPAVVFSRVRPPGTDDRDAQMLFLAGHGYRCITHERRGPDRSAQTWPDNDMDGYADDLAQLIEALDLKDAVLVGLSAGGGEVARYIGRHGRSRVAKVALIASVVPLMLKTAANPDGLTSAKFEEIRAASLTDCSNFHRDLASEPFCNADRPDARSPQGTIGGFRHEGIRAGHKATCDCIKTISETDFTEDLKMFDLPTLIIDGEDDPIMPIAAAALLAATLVGNAKLKIYPGAPQGLTGTHKDELNADLLEFLRS